MKSDDGAQKKTGPVRKTLRAPVRFFCPSG